MRIDRRGLIVGGLILAASPAHAGGPSEKLAAAARRQIGVTTGYDGAYVKLAYPGGDVPRSTGVCADVIVRAARDSLGLDLQKLLHEDMRRDFAAYPSRQAWGLNRPDANIDHRRVLNLEAYWRRAGAQVWRATGTVSGASFGQPLAVGDILTWRLIGNLPHVAIVSAAGARPAVIHNIGGGAQEAGLWTFAPHRAIGHYRWPKP